MWEEEEGTQLKRNFRPWPEMERRSFFRRRGGGKGKSYGLGTGWFSPRCTPRCRWGRFPFQHRGTASPSALPDCHLVRTAIPLPPHDEQPRCFPLQSVRFVSLFCRHGFKEQGTASRSGRNRDGLASHPPYPRKAGYVCTQRYGRKADAPHYRFPICFVRGPKIPQWEYVRAQEQVSTETGSGDPCHWKSP